MAVKSDNHGKVLASMKRTELESLMKTIPRKRKHLVLYEIGKRNVDKEILNTDVADSIDVGESTGNESL